MSKGKNERKRERAIQRKSSASKSSVSPGQQEAEGKKRAVQADARYASQNDNRRGQESEASLSASLSSPATIAKNRVVRPKRINGLEAPIIVTGKKIWARAQSSLWALLGFVVGVISGPVIQQWVFASMPGPKVVASLRAERQTNPGKLGCNFYMFNFVNFDPIDYVYAKLQFPNPVTSTKAGGVQEVAVDDSRREGSLQWGKGWNSQGKCVVSGDSITDSPDIRVTTSGNMIEIRSTSKLPLGTRIVGLIATTDLENDPGPAAHPRLWTEGAYEFSKFSQTVRKKLPIKIRFMNK